MCCLSSQISFWGVLEMTDDLKVGAIFDTINQCSVYTACDVFVHIPAICMRH